MASVRSTQLTDVSTDPCGPIIVNFLDAARKKNQLDLHAIKDYVLDDGAVSLAVGSSKGRVGCIEHAGILVSVVRARHPWKVERTV